MTMNKFPLTMISISSLPDSNCKIFEKEILFTTGIPSGPQRILKE